MFYKIIAHTPDMKRSKETVVIDHNPATSAGYIKNVAENLMLDLLYETPLHKSFTVNKVVNVWYPSCSYEGYEVNLDIDDCYKYDIPLKDWYEETGLWPDEEDWDEETVLWPDDEDWEDD